ncbi:MAG: glycosyltransferase [Syntrophorhabdaceae bacterium]|nr:glycosyltransferase [Syntrophorhabdaceae bacterium]
MDTVSVVITTFNRRHFLKDATLSVLSQDYPAKEVIIIDDGSTDGSREEVEGLPVKYIWKENSGISSARNEGIRVAKGRYISFLDVDDLWKKKKLSTQIMLMEEKGYRISYTDEIWLKNGKRINQKLRHRKYSGYIFPFCLPLCIISPSSVVIEKEVFNEVGLFDETLPVCEDYDMWLRISARYPILFVDKPLIIKRGGHEDQLSKKYEAMDRFRVKSIVNILKKGILDEEMKKEAVRELLKKCEILANGARKRNLIKEAEYFSRLPLIIDRD